MTKTVVCKCHVSNRNGRGWKKFKLQLLVSHISNRITTRSPPSVGNSAYCNWNALSFKKMLRNNWQSLQLTPMNAFLLAIVITHAAINLHWISSTPTLANKWPWIFKGILQTPIGGLHVPLDTATNSSKATLISDIPTKTIFFINIWTFLTHFKVKRSESIFFIKQYLKHFNMHISVH